MYLAGNGHGVGTGLLGDGHSGTIVAIDLLVKREVLDGVAHGGQVPYVDGLARYVGNHDVVDFGALFILTLYAHLVLFLAHFHGAGGHVQVVGTDGRADGLYAEVVGFELAGVKIDVDVAFGRSTHRDIADAIHAVELVGDVVLQYFVKSGIAFLGGEAIYQHGHGAAVELKNGGTAHSVGQVVVEQVHVAAYVVKGLVEVAAPFKLQGDNREVVLRGGGDVLQAVHRVE